MHTLNNVYIKVTNKKNINHQENGILYICIRKLTHKQLQNCAENLIYFRIKMTQRTSPLFKSVLCY